MEIFGVRFKSTNADHSLSSRDAISHRVSRTETTFRSRISFPEAQLILGIPRELDRATIHTHGFVCCSGIAIGFLDTDQYNSALYLSHTPPGFENEAEAGLKSALNISVERGYNPVFCAMLGSSRQGDMEQFNELQEKVISAIGPLGLSPLVNTYSQITDWQISHKNGFFSVSEIIHFK